MADMDDRDWPESYEPVPLSSRGPDFEGFERDHEFEAQLVAAGAKSETARTAGVLQIEWAEEIEPHLNSLWLIKKTLPQQGLALIYGHPGSGKSFLAIDIAMHVALGRDWNGQRTSGGVVVYVAAEGQKGLRNRIVAFRRHHGLEGPIPLALIPTPIDLYDSAPDQDALCKAVERAVARYGNPPALIVVDTLSKTIGAGKENTDDLAVYVANCGALAARFGCCVLPVHHRPKDAESTEPRGHGSLKGGVDTVILVEGGKTKHARITKQKDDEERQLLMFNLQMVELGTDSDGDPVTSCVIVPTFVATEEGISPFDRKVAKLSAGPSLVYGQLAELLEQSEVAIPTAIPDEEINRGRVGKVALLDDWRDKSISAGGTDRDMSRDTGKKTFNRALMRLRNDGIVRVWEQWAWITYELPE